jgi:hypothetical protein
MRIALKCKHCGYLTISKEDDVTIEIDFLEEKLTYICPQQKCKKSNVLDLSKGAKAAQDKRQSLPRIGMISG